MGRDKPLSRGEAPRHAGPSMQATQQKQEQERIALENQRMLQRITQVRPGVLLRKRLSRHRSCAKPLRRAQTTARTTEFSPSALQKSHDEHEAHLKRISRFPPPK